MRRARKIEQRRRRKRRIRGAVTGTAVRPRLTVFRSARHIYAQVIDDGATRTLVEASTLSKELRGSVEGIKKVDAAKRVGALVAAKCIEKKVAKIVFDRNGYLYHGRVRALAEGARERGLKF